MKYQLILLPEQPLIVSDEEVKKGDWYLSDLGYTKMGDKLLPDKYRKKIVTGLSHQPSIDFNGFEKEVRGVDLDKLASDFAYSELEKGNLSGNWYSLRTSFMEGFEAAQSLFKPKIFDVKVEKEFISINCHNYDGAHLGKDCSCKSGDFRDLFRYKIIKIL